MKYFTFLLGKQDEIQIQRWAKQLTTYLDSIEQYLQSVQEPWEKVNDFVQWYEESSTQATQEEKETWQEYEDWKGTYYTS